MSYNPLCDWNVSSANMDWHFRRNFWNRDYYEEESVFELQVQHPDLVPDYIKQETRKVYWKQQFLVEGPSLNDVMKDVICSNDIFQKRIRLVEKVGMNGYVFEAFIFDKPEEDTKADTASKEAKDHLDHEVVQSERSEP